jgi:pyrroline-5-carboxylate reductase
MGRLGIIGATGWLGQALGLNLLKKGLWPAENLVLLNRSGPSETYAAFPRVIWARDAREMIELCETVVLSVRPEDFPVPGFAPRDHLLISFMAAWTVDRLQSLAPMARVVRAMPNGGASTGQSYTPWLAGPGITASDAGLNARLLSAMGKEDQIETEAQLNYLSALSGSGAAYPALMARAMLTDAARRGLPVHVTLRAVEAVICGSNSLLAGRFSNISDLLDTYLSYRGITAAGLCAAEAAGFEEAVQAALAAAVAKAEAMSAT